MQYSELLQRRCTMGDVAQSLPGRSVHSLLTPAHPAHGFSVNARILGAAALALLAGTVVYIALVAATTTTGALAGWLPYVTLALPALLVGLIFEAFVMLPLLAWFRRMRATGRTPFVLASLSVWVAVCAAILAETNIDPYDFLDSASLLMLPGTVLVLVFATFAYDGDKRSRRQ